MYNYSCFIKQLPGEPTQVNIRLTPNFSDTPMAGDDVEIICQILVQGQSPYPPPRWMGPSGETVPRTTSKNCIVDVLSVFCFLFSGVFFVIFCFVFVCFLAIELFQFQLFKGMFSDTHNIFLWHELEDINEKKLIFKISNDFNLTFSSYA